MGMVACGKMNGKSRRNTTIFALDRMKERTAMATAMTMMVMLKADTSEAAGS